MAARPPFGREACAYQRRITLKGEIIMKIKKLILPLLCAVCLSACAEIPPVKEPVPIEQQEIITPPEGGWTAAELMSHSYLYDVQLEYPLTMRSLGSGFSIMGLYSTYEATYPDSDDIWYYLEYNDPENIENLVMSPAFASLTYGSYDKKPTADDPIAKLNFYSEYISLNGVKYSTPEEDIEKLLGKPDEILEYGDKFLDYNYKDKESGKELISVRVVKEKKEVTHVRISF